MANAHGRISPPCWWAFMLLNIYVGDRFGILNARRPHKLTAEAGDCSWIEPHYAKDLGRLGASPAAVRDLREVEFQTLNVAHLQNSNDLSQTAMIIFKFKLAMLVSLRSHWGCLTENASKSGKDQEENLVLWENFKVLSAIVISCSRQSNVAKRVDIGVKLTASGRCRAYTVD